MQNKKQSTKKSINSQSTTNLLSSKTQSSQKKTDISSKKTIKLNNSKKVGIIDKNAKKINLKKINAPKQISEEEKQQHDTIIQTIKQIDVDDSITIQKLNLNFVQQNKVQLKTVTSDEFNFQIDDVAIGEGVHSKVYKSFDYDSKEYYAIKIVPAINDFIYHEIDLMSRLTQMNNIIQLKKSFIMKEKEDQVVLLMELGQFNLQEIIEYRKDKGIRFNEQEIRFHTANLLNGYDEIKQMKIVHRDYKPSNIIYVAKEDKFKIGDFSEGKLIDENRKDQEHTVRGTRTFLDPELFMAYEQQVPKLVYDPYCSDLYSLGITILCMGLLDVKIDRNKIKEYLEQIKSYYSNDFYQLIQQLVSDNKKSRQFYSSYLKFMQYKNELRNDYKVYLEMLQDKQGNEDFNVKFNKIISIVDGYIKMRQFNKALESLKDLQQQCKQVNKEDLYAIVLIKMAQIYCDLHQYDTAIDQGQLALNICVKIQSQVILGSILNTLGIALTAVNDYEKALHFYQKAEKIALEKFGKDSSELADVYNNFGSLYYKQKNRKMAQIYFYKAYQIKKKGQDIDDIIGLCDILNNLGIYFNEEKDYPLAEKYLEDALNLVSVYSQKTNTSLYQIPTYINSLENIISSYTFNSKYDLAEEKLNEMESLFKQIYFIEDWHYAEIYNKRGILYAMMQNNIKAIMNFRLSISLLEDLDIERLSLLDSYYNIGVLNYKMNYKEEGLIYCEKALDLCNKHQELDGHLEQLQQLKMALQK